MICKCDKTILTLLTNKLECLLLDSACNKIQKFWTRLRDLPDYLTCLKRLDRANTSLEFQKSTCLKAPSMCEHSSLLIRWDIYEEKRFCNIFMISKYCKTIFFVTDVQPYNAKCLFSDGAYNRVKKLCTRFGDIPDYSTLLKRLDRASTLV